MTYQERVYHGIQRWEAEEDVSRILVESPEEGPTEREKVTVYRELAVGAAGGEFGWGYNGGGTSRAAAAILADALDLGDLDEAEIGLLGDDEVLVDLREDFCEDVLMHCCDEFRLRRGAVLRWARGWCTQVGETQTPAILENLPPIQHDLA